MWAFWKTISGNQAYVHSWPLVGCGNVPGLKIEFHLLGQSDVKQWSSPLAIVELC